MKPRDSNTIAVKPGISPANRSLERGVEILRAFRPGSNFLGNGEIAERTGLSKSTVSRLTQTLVGAGMLQLDARQRAYCLAPAVLSLAHAMRSGSGVLAIAAPKMRALAEKHGINVGLAAPDLGEMVYLESIRYKRRIAFRNVVSGQRIPMGLTSLGRAYLATLSPDRRKGLFALFRQRRPRQWNMLEQQIERAIQDVEHFGYCAASWQPSVVAVSTPLQVDLGSYALNVSLSTDLNVDQVLRRLAQPLLQLRHEIVAEIENSS